jgi:acid phosphatase family membrane protein YuiD
MTPVHKGRACRNADENWSLMVLIIRIFAVGVIVILIATTMDDLFPNNIIVTYSGIPSGIIACVLTALSLCLVALLRLR